MGYIVILKIDLGEPIKYFASTSAHITMWTSEFREYMRYEKRFHHSKDWTALFGYYVTY
jgi:hypothetical protein